MRAKIVTAGLLAAVLGGTMLTMTGTADAATAGTQCGYPYVCLYQGSSMRNPTGRFRDVTSGWQWLSRSRGARGFVNTRHDDVAYVLTTGNQVICIRPGTTGGMGPDGGGIKAIRISSSARCR